MVSQGQANHDHVLASSVKEMNVLANKGNANFDKFLDFIQYNQVLR